MLHEITHNVQGPHDAKFYAILDELTKECEDLMANGVLGTGIGFDGPSSGRLGAHSWIPQHNADPVAMKAAQHKCVYFRWICWTSCSAHQHNHLLTSHMPPCL